MIMIKIQKTMPVLALSLAGFFSGQNSCHAKKGEHLWNQEKAESLVNQVIKQEETKNFAWDKIDWLQDPESAALLAKQKEKPILVYFYLSGKVSMTGETSTT